MPNYTLSGADFASEIRTDRIVIGDGARHVEITPGRVSAQGGDGCHVNLSASDSFAELNVVIGDTISPDDDAQTAYQRCRSVALLATYHGAEEGAGPEQSGDGQRHQAPRASQLTADVASSLTLIAG